MTIETGYGGGKGVFQFQGARNGPGREREEVPGDPPPDHVSTAGSAGGGEVEGCQQPAGEDTGTAPDPATDAGTDRGGGMDAAAVAEAGVQGVASAECPLKTKIRKK